MIEPVESVDNTADAQLFMSLLEASQRGDSQAWASLIKMLYADLRALARSRLRPRDKRPTLNTTALVNEAYLRLAANAHGNVQSRAHFLNLASRVMRNVLCDYARERLAEKRGGGQSAVPLEVLDMEERREAHELLELDDLLREFERQNGRAARVFEARFFAGLSEQEAAESLAVSVRTVQRDWQVAREWLMQRLQA